VAGLALLERFAAARQRVALFDATSDIGVATLVCEIEPDGNDPSAPSLRFRGAGCHPDRRTALLRAMTEAAQVRLTHIAGVREDIGPEAYRRSAAQRTGAALLDALASAAGPRPLSGLPNFEADDIAAEVRHVLARLTLCGFGRAIAVDLTQPEFGIPVMRVAVPGLEAPATHPGYRPGLRALAAMGAV
jgi:YcaO-like protein with predicted kinase domain